MKTKQILERNEQTGEHAGSCAASFLAKSKGVFDGDWVLAVNWDVAMRFMEFLSALGMSDGFVTRLGDVKDLKSAIGSAMTQRPNRKKAGKR